MAFLFTGSLVVNSRCEAINTVYDTALEATYATTYKDIFYDKVSGSPLEAEAEEGVDPSTGHLLLSRTDLYLPGTGDMDFELCRYYNSNDANIGYPTVEAVEQLNTKTFNVEFDNGMGKTHMIAVSAAILDNHRDALKGMLVSYDEDTIEERKDISADDTQRTKVVSNYAHNVYGISTGWSFDFPWIETMTVKEGDGSMWKPRPVYLHFGSKGTMAIETKADEGSRSYRIQGFSGYDYQDIKLQDFNETVDGIPCRYLLRDKTGLRTYFNADGVVVLQKDAHDNTITYSYREKIYFDKITDSVGREIQFTYKEAQDGMCFLDKVTVQGAQTAGGVSKKTVTYNISKTSYTTMHNKKLYGCKLTGVTVDGSKEIYRYRTVESLVNAAGAGVASQRAATNETYLIKEVESDGSIDNYEYRAGAIRGTKDAEAGQERDVVTQFFYVTREYEQDAKTKKKANGIKYDYFQKQKGKLLTTADLNDEKHEMWQYGKEGLETLTAVSSFNPKKYKDKKKMSDYTYKKSNIDVGTLHLLKKPKKNAELYIYNTNKLLTNEVSDGKNKSETLYQYDKAEEGSLVVLETEKSYGTNRSKKPKITKQGYSYDKYRNILTEKSPKVYMAKYAGKEHLFTTSYTYFNTGSGYPEKDIGYTLCTTREIVNYLNSNTKERVLSTLAANSIDISTDVRQIQKGNQEYQTLSKTEFTYDKAGNELSGKRIPDFRSDPESYLESSYVYNQMGQRLKQEMKIYSAKDKRQNRSFTQEQSTYDSFGNELTYTNRKGLVTKTTYQEETELEENITAAAGTQYEETEKNYLSTDGTSSMKLDSYGFGTIEIKDSFGSTIIRKDEKAGTWTESDYDYGEEGESAEDESEEREPTAQLVEERVYSFEPEGKLVSASADGKEEIHYDIAGRGKEILQASRHIYDGYGAEIVSAQFSGGAIDASHCSSWTMDRETEEVSEDQTVTTSYHKELDPTAYQQEVDQDNYYNQFDKYVLTETISETVTDEEGNVLSQTSTVYCDGHQQETVTNYEQDDFGLTISDHTTIRKDQAGNWLQKQEIKNTYEYDDLGHVTKTITQSRLSEEDEWEEQVIKAVYDTKGQLIESYTPRGGAENYATRYAYDLQGQRIKEWRPVSKKNGEIKYQMIKYEYDEGGNIIASEEQLSEEENGRTEYTYNDRNELVCVKSCARDDKNSAAPSLYVQYVYDIEGNKVRQFTGMTKPLTIIVKEGKGEDSYTYAGKTYHIEVSGGPPKDKYSETKYVYNKRNQLISIIDPEGNRETYTYDLYGNLKTAVDKNGNTTTYTYDYQGRLLSQMTEIKDTGKKSTHHTHYDVYGNIDRQDGVTYTYDNLNNLVKKEREKIAGKEVEKTYTYDSGDNCCSFNVSVGGKNQLLLSYDYDGFSRLSAVNQKEGGRTKQIAAYSYNEDGSLVTSKIPVSGLVTHYSYDYAGNLTELKNTGKSNALLSKYTSTYRLNGQKVSEREERVTKAKEREISNAEYTYDRLGRLRTESDTGEETVTYSYDSHGNRKEMVQGDRVTAYRYDKNEELQRTDTLNKKTSKDTVALYKYDRSGNELAVVHRKKTDAKGPVFDLNVTVGQNQLNPNAVYHYDAENQLTSALMGKNKVLYTYDASGYRTSKTVNGKTTNYIWDGDQIVMELNEKAKVKKRYFHGDSLICSDSGEGTKPTYYVSNSHGDVVQLLNQEGTVMREYSYDAFGNEVNPDKKDDNPFRYAGEYYDKETASMYLRARYYTPATGRFMTRDTYTGEAEDPLSLHLYAYCDNDGVNQVDPSGHWGRANGKYVHQEMTKEAFDKYVDESKYSSDYYLRTLGIKNYDTIIDGSILPDLLNSDNKKIFGSTGTEREKLNKICKKIDKMKKAKKDKKSLNHLKKKAHSKYYKKYYKKYKKQKWKVLGINISSDNMLHGKSKSKLKKLKDKAVNQIKNASYKEQTEAFLLLGCVLHSIQDYVAHSIKEADLETFKGSNQAKKNSYSQKVQEFHWDWNKENTKDREKGEEAHKNTKDNPNAIFDYNYKTGKWEWRPRFHSAEVNVRYEKAVNKSKKYLDRAIPIF